MEEERNVPTRTAEELKAILLTAPVSPEEAEKRMRAVREVDAMFVVGDMVEIEEDSLVGDLPHRRINVTQKLPSPFRRWKSKTGEKQTSVDTGLSHEHSVDPTSKSSSTSISSSSSFTATF